MSRLSIPLLAFLCSLFTASASLQAQVGFGVRQQNVTSGGFLNVAPVVTRGGTHVRMGISVGFSQIVDVQTFSPVQNFPGLVPVAPIGFGVVGGFNQGFNGNAAFNNGFNGQGAQNTVAKPKPTVQQFVNAAARFDTDKDSRLNREELSEMATAVVAELKRTAAVPFDRLTAGSKLSGEKKATPPTAEEINETFVKQCLKYDRDKDEALNAAETRRMAAALIKSLS